MRLSSGEIEEKVIKYCELRGIPHIRGKVAQKYEHEIGNFIGALIKRRKKETGRTKYYKNQEISNIVTRILPKVNIKEVVK